MMNTRFIKTVFDLNNTLWQMLDQTILADQKRKEKIK